jgi:hypothetical protein
MSAAVETLVRTAPAWNEVGTKIRRDLLFVGAAVVAIAWNVCIAELLLRASSPYPPVERVYRRDNSLSRYGLMPSRRVEYVYKGRHLVITTDAAAHRIVPGAPVAVARKLYLIGDSQTFGWGLSDNETIAASLQKRLGPQWQVINLGVPGYGPFAYAEILEKLPDDGITVVIQAELNDFQDAVVPRSQLTARCGFLVTRSTLAQSTPCFVLSSYLLAKAADFAIDASGALPVPMGYQRHARATARVLRYRIANLYERARLLRQNRVIVTTIPWDAAILPERLANYRPTLTRTERIVSLPADLDLEPSLLAARSKSELFQRRDSHLSAVGAAVVAERLAAAISAGSDGEPTMPTAARR